MTTIQPLIYLLRNLLTPRKFPRVITSLLILLSAGSLFILSLGTPLKLTKEGVVLRSTPATNSGAIQTLTTPQTVFILKEESGWYKIRVNGKEEGWIPIWMLNNVQVQSDQKLLLQANTSTPVYQSENTNSPVVATLNAGDTAPISSEALGWAKVTVNKQIGYVQTDKITIMNEAQTTLTQISTDSSILASEVLQVRATNQAFLAQANNTSDILYTIEPNQQFKFISSTQDANGIEFYLAEDERGQRGYIDSANAAFEQYSKTHMNAPKVATLAEATIVIDAGHGGEDAGAVNDTPYTLEKEVALSTSKALQAELEAKGAKVIMIRTEDADVSLEERASLSEQYQADAFISIHYDAAIDEEWSGTTTYYYHNSDRPIADFINNELLKLKTNNNGVRFGNYLVLRENDQPSILLELGYMSNLQDVRLFRTEEYQTNVAKAIATGLEQYFLQAQAE